MVHVSPLVCIWGFLTLARNLIYFLFCVGRSDSLCFATPRPTWGENFLLFRFLDVFVVVHFLFGLV